jgi:hypothetical protein
MISPTRKTVEEVAREQFDEFERRERLLRMEERRERAARPTQAALRLSAKDLFFPKGGQ